MDAGIKVFARRGYDAATTREVAQEAGVNEQLIQRYFGGKAGLVLAIVRRYGDDERRCACALPPRISNLEQEIGRFLAFQLAHDWDKKDFAKVVLYRAIVDPEVAGEVGRHLAEGRIPLLRERLVELQSEGLVAATADLDAAAHALSSLSLALGLIDQVLFGVDRSQLEKVAAYAARIFAAGLAVGEVALPAIAPEIAPGS